MSQPFARAPAMMALIAAAIAGPGAQSALAAITPYKSHGHGRSKPFCKSWASLSASHPGSKYMPHQGKKECAKRMVSHRFLKAA